MSTRYAMRVWKRLFENEQFTTWHNTYIVESDLMTGGAEWLDAMCSPAKAERHIHMPQVQFLRVDLGPVDYLGHMHHANDFWTIRFPSQGIRDTQGATDLEQSKYGLVLKKMLTSGNNGHQVYRHVFHAGEIGGKESDAIWWNATPYWIAYVWKWFRFHQEDLRIRQYVTHRLPGSNVIGGYRQVYDWAVGTPIKLETWTDAQNRKRPAGAMTKARCDAAAQTASEMWWLLQDALIAHQDDIPGDLVDGPQSEIGAAIATYKPVLRYFAENQAPTFNTTRWQQPRADPYRNKAMQAINDWKMLEDDLKELIERKAPDPVSQKIPRDWVLDLQVIAKDCCAWINVVLYSRFT